MEEQVRQALENFSWDAEAAHRWMTNNLGSATPNLDYFERVRALAATAAWQEAVKNFGIQNFPGKENETLIAMGGLADYLEDNAKNTVIRQAQQEHNIRNPRPFLGFGEGQK